MPASTPAASRRGHRLVAPGVPSSLASGGGSGCRSTSVARLGCRIRHGASSTLTSGDAGEERRRPSRRQRRRGTAPGRGVGQALVGGAPGQADASQTSGAASGIAGGGQDRHDAQHLERVAHHARRPRGRARPSTARSPRGGRWSSRMRRHVASRATDGWTASHAGRGVGVGRRRRRPPAGCRVAAPGRRRRTSCRRRWPRGRAGCRGCWRGRSCSGRPCPRSVKSPSGPKAVSARKW